MISNKIKEILSIRYKDALLNNRITYIHSIHIYHTLYFKGKGYNFKAVHCRVKKK